MQWFNLLFAIHRELFKKSVDTDATKAASNVIREEYKALGNITLVTYNNWLLKSRIQHYYKLIYKKNKWIKIC